MIRIGTIIEHAIFSDSIELLINSACDMKVVRSSNSAKDFSSRMQSKPIKMDVLLYDIDDSTESPISSLKKIIRKGKGVKTILFCSVKSAYLKQKALEAGASAYLLKNTTSSSLLNCLREVNKGTICHRNTKGFTSKVQLEETELLNSLSDRELNILMLVSQGFTSTDIAAKLHLSHFTVDSHRKNIKAKIGGNVVDWTNLVHRHGLFLL